MLICNQKQVSALLACNAIPLEAPAYMEGKLEICGRLRGVHSSICNMQLHTCICIYGELMHRIDSILRLSDSNPGQHAMQTSCLMPVGQAM